MKNCSFSHPADYTPVCTTELGRVEQLVPEFKKRGFKLIALSCDTTESHKGWIEDIKAYNKVLIAWYTLFPMEQLFKIWLRLGKDKYLFVKFSSDSLISSRTQSLPTRPGRSRRNTEWWTRTRKTHQDFPLLAVPSSSSVRTRGWSSAFSTQPQQVSVLHGRKLFGNITNS